MLPRTIKQSSLKRRKTREATQGAQRGYFLLVNIIRPQVRGGLHIRDGQFSQKHSRRFVFAPSFSGCGNAFSAGRGSEGDTFHPKGGNAQTDHEEGQYSNPETTKQPKRIQKERNDPDSLRGFPPSHPPRDAGSTTSCNLSFSSSAGSQVWKWFSWASKWGTTYSARKKSTAVCGAVYTGVFCYLL